MAVSSSLQVVSAYVAALTAQDTDAMDALLAQDFVLDFVHRDAFETNPTFAQETQMFWPTWFAAFPEFDLEISRTVAAEEVVVTQWIFSGTHTGPLETPIFGKRLEPTGRTIRLRGVSVYDVVDGRILRETLYTDLLTLMVELGVEL